MKAILIGLLPALCYCQESRSISATRADHPPALTGVLDDTWSQAARVFDFHQREPFETQPPTEKTEVRVFYDRKYLYFGIHCFDSIPAGIRATELRRDTDFTVDDHFSVLISPNNDGHNGYIFTVNPLGTQFDSSLTDEGRVEDPNWDGIWISNARITADGWDGHPRHSVLHAQFQKLRRRESRNQLPPLHSKEE